MFRNMLADGVNLFFQALYLIMIARILLTWFPNLNWYAQPYKSIKEITDPIFEPFRRIIPPYSGIDFSPIVAFLALSIVHKIVIFAISNI